MHILICNIIVICLSEIEGCPSLYLDKLDKFPEVPYEATTFEQDDLIYILKGTFTGEITVTWQEACDRLIADESLPIVLRNWALRKKMYLFYSECQIREALRIGREWIQKYGNTDADSFLVRWLMATYVSEQKCYADYSPLYHDVKEVFDGLFANMPDDDETLYRAHLRYADALEKFVPMHVELHQQVIKHLDKAILALKRYQPQQEADETEFQKKLERKDLLLKELEEKYSRKSEEKTPEKPEYTEEEYLEDRNRIGEGLRKLDENERFMRQYKIYKGLFNPNDPSQHFSISNQEIRDPEYIRFKERMLEEERTKNNNRKIEQKP